MKVCCKRFVRQYYKKQSKILLLRHISLLTLVKRGKCCINYYDGLNNDYISLINMIDGNGLENNKLDIQSDILLCT